MIFEITVSILSVISASIILIVLIRTKKVDRKYKLIYEDRDNITFIKKDISGLHSRYDFVINEQGIDVKKISVVDKIALHVGLINPGSKPEVLKCNKKNINKYKHAKLLLNFLVDNIKTWGL